MNVEKLMAVFYKNAYIKGHNFGFYLKKYFKTKKRKNSKTITSVLSEKRLKIWTVMKLRNTLLKLIRNNAELKYVKYKR